MTPALAYRHALRTDYLTFYERCFATLDPGGVFEDSWHLHAIAEQLRRVDRGEVRRLIVNVPPRSGGALPISHF